MLITNIESLINQDYIIIDEMGFYPVSNLYFGSIKVCDKKSIILDIRTNLLFWQGPFQISKTLYHKTFHIPGYYISKQLDSSKLICPRGEYKILEGKSLFMQPTLSLKKVFFYNGQHNGAENIIKISPSILKPTYHQIHF